MQLPHDAVGFDTETKGLAWHAGETAFLGTWAHADTDHVAPLVGEEGREGTARYLKALQAGTLVAHNLKFDAHQTRETTGWDLFDQSGVDLHDTDLMSRILLPEGQTRERGGHGLKNLATVFLRADAADAEDRIKALAKTIWPRRTQPLKHPGAYYELWTAYPEAMEEYAKLDARYTRDLAADFLPRFKDDAKLWKLYNVERQVQRVLYRAEQGGVRVDSGAVARLKAHYKGRDGAARTECEAQLGFVPEGEGSDERLAEALLKAGVPLTEETPTGQIAVNRQVLYGHAGHPAVAALFEFNRVQKFLSTYIAPMEGVEFVHPDFRQAEAWTGRMSCTRPNMQNLPKRSDAGQDENLRLRSMFVPRDDHYFVVADFESVEPRVLAHFLGVPAYREVVTAGLTYETTAAAVWGGSPEDYRKGGPRAAMRNVAKMVYLALTYGAGAAKLREQINRDAPPAFHVDPDWVKDPTNKFSAPPQAQAIKKAVIASIPGFDALAGRNGRAQRAVREKGYVRTLLGRKQLVNPEKSYVALNALVQGSAADLMKQAAVNLADLEGTPLLFVHDEVLMEYPNDYDPAKAVAEVTEAMVAAGDGLTLPLAVEAYATTESYAHVGS